MFGKIRQLKQFRFQYSDDMSRLMKRAETILLANNIEGLKDLQRTILRALQSRIMLAPYLAPDHTPIGEINFNFCSSVTMQRCCKGSAKANISLKEPIITFPWHPDRILNNLGTIGPNRIKGHFKSSSNHSVNYYWPLMLAQVTGGNHSIAQGIIMGEGNVEIDDWYDLTPLMDRYRYDGNVWLDVENEQTVCHCITPELGMAWEIGRLISRKCPPPFGDNS
ncbi:hypothetical protein KW458_02830 [Vibrio fluvialis]|nr:hypothetical protein [Vibrio fluvialis]